MTHEEKLKLKRKMEEKFMSLHIMLTELKDNLNTLVESNIDFASAELIIDSDTGTIYNTLFRKNLFAKDSFDYE